MMRIAAKRFAPVVLILLAQASVEAQTTRYVVAPEGNEARYRVREQLVRRDLPNDAVGATQRIEGSIVLDAAGQPVPGESRIAVDLASLTSDAERRDRYIKGRTLEVEQYPVAVIELTRFVGLDGGVPADGVAAFRIEGDMTVHGVTAPVVWEATARREGEAIVGQARTNFPFGHFGLEIPRVGILLSVDDDIRLEYDFRFVPAGG